MTPSTLFKQIELASPGFGAVAQEHFVDNGELLPHLLMADLLRYIGASANRASVTPASETEIRAALSVLEFAARCGDPETENVVAMSFCECIESESFFPKLQPMLGLALRRAIRDRRKAAHAR
jgi:hypothetical protein